MVRLSYDEELMFFPLENRFSEFLLMEISVETLSQLM
jgi:hypothetical protein